MIVRDDNPSDPSSINSQTAFHFITEIFYMTHVSYSISVHRLHRMLLKVSSYDQSYRLVNVFH
jgi:hypothetical protein